MSDTPDDDSTELRPLHDRLDCPGCVRSFRTASDLDRHLGRNPSHSRVGDVDSVSPSPQVWDNGWVRFADRVERAVLLPRATERVDVEVVERRNIVEISGDYDTTVPLPRTAGASADTLSWRAEAGVLRLTLDTAEDGG